MIQWGLLIFVFFTAASFVGGGCAFGMMFDSIRLGIDSKKKSFFAMAALFFMLGLLMVWLSVYMVRVMTGDV